MHSCGWLKNLSLKLPRGEDRRGQRGGGRGAALHESRDSSVLSIKENIKGGESFCCYALWSKTAKNTD